MDSEVQKRQGFFSKIPRKLKWLIAALVFNNIAIGYLIVYLTGFFPELGVSAGVVGLLLGLEGAMVLLSIPLGILSDRRGRKKLLLIGTFLVPIPIIMIGLTPSPPRPRTSTKPSRPRCQLGTRSSPIRQAWKTGTRPSPSRSSSATERSRSGFFSQHSSQTSNL